MENETNVRLAEEKAIREAEFIAASESIKLTQELSLRLGASEPNSKNSSRSPSISDIQKNNDNDEQQICQPYQIDQTNSEDENENKNENVNENENEKEYKEENLDEEQDKFPKEGENIEKSLSKDEIGLQISNTIEPIIEIKENEYESQFTKQESKLILNEFRHDSLSFKKEQEETNGHSNDSEITILKEPENQDLENNQHSSDEILLINSQKSVEIQGCNHKLHEISDYTKSGISIILEFQKSIIDNCKNTNSVNTQLKKSSLDYFDSLHSKLINLAGFHSPDECSICKDFRHQDVPLLN
ncbi:uncharacterized protein cubi_01962 [Cryptosporidium ubiquitum]|uniref:Uncharacterized protein n=1 Tax=Cryptosporidium ubiquitum TaxID=857276 RepID=A0A1J4MMH2_9CRYT|nr:uncharacterized protein cubi_01962 [Cryptosporidium ubiquitum]OII75441.1 hypothetical protein cubi_01962 [Cryptosporidium ubiquitum]